MTTQLFDDRRRRRPDRMPATPEWLRISVVAVTELESWLYLNGPLGDEG